MTPPRLVASVPYLMDASTDFAGANAHHTILRFCHICATWPRQRKEPKMSAGPGYPKFDMDTLHLGEIWGKALKPPAARSLPDKGQLKFQ